ncbi:MAG: hypothetical protein LQ340_002709 [Diploschistes diacapsis]|nr:MAG: hypothetical protein LQ340_002709 [Diploschistes diacapsis]
MSSSGPERIFITGGAGFVGRAIISRIQSTHPDWLLFCYDNVSSVMNPSTPPNPSVNHEKVTYITGDITDQESVEAALSKASPTLVIHTAGIVPSIADRYSRRREKEVFKTNIGGTETLLSASKATLSVRGFVWTGSCCSVIDDTRFQYPYADESWRTSSKDSTIYGESKSRAEALVLAANEPTPSSPERKGKPFLTTALRPCVLFGPDDYQLIPSVHACIAKHEMPYIIGDGLNFWDITDVRNVGHAHVLAAENLLSSNPTAAGEAFFIANGCPIPFRDFCRQVWKNFGAYPTVEVHVPVGLASLVAGVTHFVGMLLGMRPTLSPGSVADACAVRYCSEKKANNILGYEPIVGLEEGLWESCEAYKRRLRDGAEPKEKVLAEAGKGENVKV